MSGSTTASAIVFALAAIEGLVAVAAGFVAGRFVIVGLVAAAAFPYPDRTSVVVAAAEAAVAPVAVAGAAAAANRVRSVGFVHCSRWRLQTPKPGPAR